jgi:hypothetical protein
MEALSPTMEEGRLVKWLKNEGDAVKSGEALAEVETDKAIMELVARGDGVLRKRLINEGDTAPVGALAGVIATADENIDALVAGAGTPAPAAGAPAPEKVVAAQQETAGASSVPRRAEESQGEASTPPQQKVADAPAAAPGGASRAPAQPGGNNAPPPAGGDVRSSPLARRLASERGLDLQSVQGSGPNGRIIKRDIEAAAAAGAAAPRAAAAPALSAPVIPREGEHCSIITHGKMVLVALQVADQLKKEGINIDVVDLRTIRPMDVEAIAASVKKTNRAVVLEEGWEMCGVGAQVVDYIQRECFDHLDAPVVRVHQADTPMTYAKNLERAAKPDAAKTIAAVKKVMYLE